MRNKLMDEIDAQYRYENDLSIEPGTPFPNINETFDGLVAQHWEEVRAFSQRAGTGAELPVAYDAAVAREFWPSIYRSITAS